MPCEAYRSTRHTFSCQSAFEFALSCCFGFLFAFYAGFFVMFFFLNFSDFAITSNLSFKSAKSAVKRFVFFYSYFCHL